MEYGFKQISLLDKLYDLVENPKCPFVIYVGNKRLIKRKEFV